MHSFNEIPVKPALFLFTIGQSDDMIIRDSSSHAFCKNPDRALFSGLIQTDFPSGEKKNSGRDQYISGLFVLQTAAIQFKESMCRVPCT
jgi:hypothetical protein